MRRAILVFAIVALIAASLCAVGSAVAAPSPCTITLQVSDTSLEAEVNSTLPDAVTTMVNYTISKPSGTRAVLTLMAAVDVGWVATVSPSSITITNQVAGPSTLTVVVPPGSRPSEPGTATVVARLTVSGVQCEDTSEPITVTPQPYLDSLEAHLDRTNITLKKGVATPQLTVGAASNVPVVFTISYEFPAGLTGSGPATVRLPLNDQGKGNVTDGVPLRGPALEPGAYTIRIRVHAEAEGADPSEAVLVASVAVSPVDPVAAAAPFIPIVAVAVIGVGAVVWWKRR